jgi:hypothetical protein
MYRSIRIVAKVRDFKAFFGNVISLYKWRVDLLYALLEIYRYTILELIFVPEFNTGTYQYILHKFILFLFFWRYILVPLLRSIPELLNFHFEHCLQVFIAVVHRPCASLDSLLLVFIRRHGNTLIHCIRAFCRYGTTCFEQTGSLSDSSELYPSCYDLYANMAFHSILRLEFQ